MCVLLHAQNTLLTMHPTRMGNPLTTTHPHLHHNAPKATTSGVTLKITEARMHSHLKRSREHTTNNHLGSPQAPHHGPRVTPGHAVGDANRATECRCQRATTRDGPPMAATAIAIARHNDDDNLGGPLCLPPPLSAGLHPGVGQKRAMQVRYSHATCTSSRDRDRVQQHTDDLGGPLCLPPLSPLGNTPASCRSARCGISTRAPHTPATTAAIAIACSHTMNRGRQLHPPPLPPPGPMPQCRAEARGTKSGTYACDQRPTVTIATVCSHHNELGVPAAPPASVFAAEQWPNVACKCMTWNRHTHDTSLTTTRYHDVCHRNNNA
jgi:hypothetical protein